MDCSIPRAIVELKNEFMKVYRGSSLLSEVVPLGQFPIDSGILERLHKFAEANPIYNKSFDLKISGTQCRVYQGDINDYWLSSKKHDANYQPFYPTWLLSAFALANGAKSLGFEQLVDVGSGDGRIAYCGALLGMKSRGLEIDADLVRLQMAISEKTGVNYGIIDSDATRFDYGSLSLSRPIFFISGLPEMGEMLANSVIKQIVSMSTLKDVGFNFMGSHVMKSFTRDKTGWGWGNIISKFDLKVVDTFTLPTLWTTDQEIDTAYVYTVLMRK